MPHLLSSIDLHVHLRGTIEPALALQLSQKNKIQIPSGIFDSHGNYSWRDFDEFLTIYDQVGHVICKPEDIHFIASRYLAKSAAEGTLYVEFMLSPDHSRLNGIPYEEQVAALSQAIEKGRENLGIESSLIVTAVRHRGPEDALQLAEMVVAQPHDIVTGFGLTGNERKFSVDEFSGAFLIAQKAGLGLTAHVGEWTDARTVLSAVDTLNLTRVGHGTRAAEDPNILAELVARGIGFEVCLSSNLALNVCEKPEMHPLKKMLDAGCKVCLATDDPAYFQTTPFREHCLASERFGLSNHDLRKIVGDAVDMAFCPEETKHRIRKELSRRENQEVAASS